MTAPNDTALHQAVDRLVTVGAAAGLDAARVRTEAGVVAAAVAESAPGAPADWVRVFGRDELREFFGAANAGRRLRTSPSDTLVALRLTHRDEATAYADALVELAAAAAVGLGRPSPIVAQVASEVATAQRGSSSAAPAPALPTPSLPATPPAAVDLTSFGSSATPSGPAGRSNDYLPTPDLGRGLDGLPGLGEILDALGGRSPVPAPGAPVTATDQPGQPGVPAVADAATAATETAAAVEAAEAEPLATLEELMAELDDLVGLDRAKSQVKRQVEMLRVEKLRTEAGLTRPTLTRHLVFVGNPGTGKTTVARLVSGIYRALGLLSKGHLIEVDRSELVAGYLGQTAAKTSEVVTSALGGVLFIDEAYALSQGVNGPDAYGSEAVNTLVKDMEDHRDDLVVIVAGYPGPMREFIETNPGLESRFATTISFEDYTDPELRAIFTLMAQGADFTPTSECLERVEELTSIQVRHAGFGNARFVRNLLDAAIARHAWRLRDVEAPTLEQLRELLPEDLVDPSGGDVDDALALLAPTEPDPEATLEPDSESVPEPEVEPDVEPEVEPDVEPDPHPSPDPEAESDTAPQEASQP